MERLKQFDVFLSYSRVDELWVIKLKKVLRKRKLKVWLDKDEIRPGELFVAAIEKGLEESKAVVLVVSPESLSSGWVNEEYSRALTLAQTKNEPLQLIPVILRNADLPGFLTNRNWIDFRDPATFGVDIERLIWGITGQKPEEEGEGLPSKAEAPAKQRLRLRKWLLWGSIAAVVVIVGLKLFWSSRESPPTLPRPVKKNVKDGLNYVSIPPGHFTMGCSAGDSECHADEQPAHETVIKGFWMGQTPVTQAAYQRVMKSNPSYFLGQQLPVETVTWDQAKAYCEAVGGRLPTEAEWEYAARAGTDTARYDDLDAIAWYEKNSADNTHQVAQKEGNAWKLYDMLGNVWEWVGDRYDSHYYENPPLVNPTGPASDSAEPAPPEDPTGSASDYDLKRSRQSRAREPARISENTPVVDSTRPASGEYKVGRGGSWLSGSRDLRSSHRHWYQPGFRDSTMGFRCVWFP